MTDPNSEIRVNTRVQLSLPDGKTILGTVLDVNDQKPGDVDITILWDETLHNLWITEVHPQEVTLQGLAQEDIQDKVDEARKVLKKYKEDYEKTFNNKNKDQLQTDIKNQFCNDIEKLMTSNNPEKSLEKEVGRFDIETSNSRPTMALWLDAIHDATARLTKATNIPLTEFQVGLFTFIHEFEHYSQWQQGKVTTAEIQDPNFKNSEKAKQLEREADQAASNFIQKYCIAFDSRALVAMMSQPPIPKVVVGQQVTITKDIHLVDTIYYDNQFHCGGGPNDAVDIGSYKITVKQGTQAVVNSISGNQVQLIDLSDVGAAVAFDPIKGRNISTPVVVHRIMSDMDSIDKVI